MDVGIVIPLFDGARWVGETLAAIAAQTLRPAQVLVIDDGSTDGGAEIARRQSWVTVLDGPRQGPNPARRFGLAQIETDLVAMLDQDDLWHPQHLERLVDILARDPLAPAAVASVVCFQDGQAPTFEPQLRGSKPLDPWAGYPLRSGVATPSAVLIRRQELLRIGGWPVAFPGLGDQYTWLCLSVRRPLTQSQAVTTAYRIHERSLSVKLRHDPTSYFDSFVGAADAAYQRRLAFLQDAEARKGLGRRCRIAHHCRELAAAWREQRLEDFRSAAQALDCDLAGEPPHYQELPFHHLLWLLNTETEEAAHGARTSAIHWKLLTDWPRQARTSRACLRRLMLRASLYRRLVTPLAILSRWRRGAQALARQHRP